MRHTSMRQISIPALLAAALFGASAAHAQEAPADDLTVTGTVSLASQYRLRGISLSDEDPAVQGSITVSHSSGVYVGTWASSLAGFGSFGGSNMELDLIAGYTTKVGNVTLDGGLIWYLYPGTDDTDYAEVYASVSAPVGPLNAKLGTFYAPDQQSIGGEDNIYVYTDWALPIAGSPITLKAHGGYTTGNGSTLAGPDGDYFDYAVGADFAYKNLTLNLSYLGTDMDGAPADAFFGSRDIVDDAIVASITASF